MAGQNQMPNMDQFETYFRRADLDQDGRISGAEAVGFFQGSNLPKQVLAQIWTYADQNRTGFLGRAEFYNALKLVTVAQRKRELTPDIVKAALYSPASAQIPPPQINLAAIPAPQPNFRPGAPTPQFSGTGPTSQGTAGFRGPQGFTPQPNQFMRPPRPLPPSTTFHSQPGFGSQGMPGGGTMAASRPPTPQGVGSGAPQVGVTSQGPTRGISPSTALDGFGFTSTGSTQLAQPRPQATVGLTQPAAPKPNESTLPVLGNGFASDSMFGDVFSATPSQAKQDSLARTSSSGGLPATSAIVPASSGPQNAVMSSGLPVSSVVPVSAGPQQTVTSSPQMSLQSTFTQQPTVNQHQQIRPTANQNQVSARNLTGYPSGPGNSAPGQSQQPWPRMTPASVQKYSKVFVEVDTDRDGKITGEQARNLFLSWRLPREILKQVWDLSDQDNDSMLSLREFCVALYLMERYREGRPLPLVLPSGIMLDETQLPPSGQLAASHGNTAWAPTPGMPGARPVPQATSARPPRSGPVPIPQEEEAMPPRQQKPRVPVLEKHLVDQLSTEEQNSLNSKFQEATEADKKVDELEKEILDARQKIEYYRTKMQELILYKSRCDNRLNEITERVSTDKREVEALAKKYEEKYKQSGDVASKLTIEEATFRDIQEKKMELYRAIVKLEEDGNPDAIQGRADRIQLDLEEQVKALNERCKVYGLRGKPTTLVELPFGWQPGIQEGAADLDEGWDKFEDEGFTFVKEFTRDVQNVIAPPKTKSSLIRDKPSSTLDESTAVSSNNQLGPGEKNHKDESENLPSKDGVSRTSPESPSRRNAMDSPINSPARKYSIDTSPFDSPSRKNTVESPSSSPTIRNSMESPTKKFDVSPSGKNNGDHSPHFDTQSEHGGSEYKGFDEPGWGTFDTHYDTDAGWDFNPKETNREVHSESSFFGADDWGLNPIKTGPTYTDNANQKKSSFPFADSVPGTPAYSSVGSPQANNLFQSKAPFGFADSVPSTPMYNTVASPFANNLFQNKSSFGFADSVPSTPMFNDVPETNSFDTFSRFDSFSLNDGPTGGSLFTPRDSSLSRFDSMRSTRDSEFDHGFYPPSDSSSSFARFDSMRSTGDSDFGPGLTRFDSMRSTSDFGHGFQSFDDTDPFGSSDPFRSSDPFKTSSSTIESQTPRRDSDSWRAF